MNEQNIKCQVIECENDSTKDYKFCKCDFLVNLRLCQDHYEEFNQN